MTKVFLSSVSRGLSEARARILDGLRTARLAAINMESFGAQIQRPLATCLQELRQADALVVVVGPRYGSLTPAGDVSYTQEEFREARRRGIPVLAFVLDPSPECDELERSRLSAFVDEAGQALTFKRTSLDDLPTQIVASLMAALSTGALGRRYSVFQPADRYFAQQLQPSTGLHSAAPLVGRDSELNRVLDFVLRSAEGVLLVVAAGGVGKSRLLLEAARSVVGTPAAPRMLFVDAGATWDAEDINSLPTAETILVVDDAHRRPDLDRLISAAQQVNPKIRFVVSCRPGAIDVVRPHLGGLSGGTAKPVELVLTPLGKDAATQLAKKCLGAKYASNAKELVRVADGNALVITVGGRCIAQDQVAPALLEQSPDRFKQEVLDRLLDDPALRSDQRLLRRPLLEIVAALSPFNAEDEVAQEQCARRLKIPTSELGREIAELEHAGLLQRRGRLLRVTPDVLSDHLLYRSAVDRTGRPTGFVGEILEAFGPGHLGNVLANASELDWRLSARGDQGTVLASIWRSLEQELPQLPHGRRADLIKELKRAAVFAPEPVLKIAEWVADHPEAPRDPRLDALGLTLSFDASLEPASELIGFIATHPDFTARCMPRLWKLAVEDERPTNPNPSHPRRRIAELLKYDDNVHTDVQRQVIEFVCDRLGETLRTDRASWAIEALSNALDRDGEANSSEGMTFTLRTFPLAPSLKRLKGRRKRVTKCLVGLAWGTRLEEAALAIRQLSKLLRPPEAKFNRVITNEELGAWLSEASDAARALAEVASRANAPVLRYMARRELRESLNGRWQELEETTTRLLKEVPEIPEASFFDRLVGSPWSEELDDWKDEQERVREKCREAAGALWKQHATAASVGTAVIDLVRAVSSVYRLDSGDIWVLVGELVKQRPAQSGDLARFWVNSGLDEAMALVPPTLAGMAQSGRRSEMEGLVEEFASSQHERLRARVADALRYLVGGKDGRSSQLDLVRVYLEDKSRDVRIAAIRPLSSFSEIDPRGALDLLVQIDWNGDRTVAEVVCDQLDEKFGLDPGLLQGDEIDLLLSRLEFVPSLDGHHHDMLGFVDYASTRRSRQTLEMLVRRVRASTNHDSERGDDRWTPIPYNGHGLKLSGLPKSPDFHDLLRLARETALDEDSMVHFWSPTLFEAAATDFVLGEPVLREWVASQDVRKIVGAAHLLGGFDRSVLFSKSEFMADLLDAAVAAEGDCLDRTKSELHGLALSGVYGGTPGEPAPRHLEDKKLSSALAAKFVNRPVVQAFYLELSRRADDDIQRDLSRFDEMEVE